jgi:hypothetical protein
MTCIILTKMVAFIFCKIRGISISIQAPDYISKSWRMDIETMVMRENPKVRILVWLIMRQNLMDIGA